MTIASATQNVPTQAILLVFIDVFPVSSPNGRAQARATPSVASLCVCRLQQDVGGTHESAHSTPRDPVRIAPAMRRR